MRTLVTGGQGFIGQYVAEELKLRGHTPILFDNHFKLTKYHVVIGDITNPTSVMTAMANVDSWIHLAAVLGTQETIENPIPAAETNILGGLNVLQAAAQYNLPGTYIGVGNHFMNNTYSISKTTIERFIDMYNLYRGTKINIVRAVNAYGPRQEPVAPYGYSKVRKVTPSFICRALNNQDIEIYGDGSQISDMIYVTDVATALVNSLEKAVQGDISVLSIGPKKSNTIKYLAEMILGLTNSSSVIRYLPMRKGEVPAVVSAKAGDSKKLGMSELVSLEDGLIETIKYYKERI